MCIRDRAGTEEAAGAEGEEGLGELAGALAALDGLERIQPVVHPAVHVRFEGPDGVRAEGGEQQSDRDPADPPGGGEQHDHEQSEEQQRGPQIPLQDQHTDAEQPDREDRAEDAAGEEPELPEEPAAGEGERGAVRGEVGGEEDREQDLGELPRLEGEPGEPDPDVRAVDRREEDGDQHQDQGHRDGEVRVALEHPVVAEQGDDQHEERHAQGGPQELVPGGEVPGGGDVEALDEDEAEAVEEDGDGEQEGIGVRGPQADGEVREQGGDAQAGGVAGGGAGDAAGGREADVEVTEDGDQDGSGEERQLDAAPLGGVGAGGRGRGGLRHLCRQSGHAPKRSKQRDDMSVYAIVCRRVVTNGRKYRK